MGGYDERDVQSSSDDTIRWHFVVTLAIGRNFAFSGVDNGVNTSFFIGRNLVFTGIDAKIEFIIQIWWITTKNNPFYL